VRATLAAGATAAALLSAAGALQALRERRFPPPEETVDALYLTSGAAVGRLTRGYNALAADLYWIRAIQHYGRNKIGAGQTDAVGPAPDYHLLYPLLDLTTSLDPRFNIAYRFGAVFLAEPPPGGPGRPDQAMALLAKGLREQPDKWEYMQDIGFVHYWWRQDYPAAAEWFDRASRVPGAPWWLRSLAATTLADGGDRRSSRLMWESIRESAEVDWLRQDAEKRLLQFQALDDIDALQARADRLAASLGAPPSDWTALVRAGALRAIPADPAGTPYQIDTLGRVSVSDRSPLHPLPTEPGRRSRPQS
jgi:hypothetical protein